MQRHAIARAGEAVDLLDDVDFSCCGPLLPGTEKPEGRPCPAPGRDVRYGSYEEHACRVGLFAGGSNRGNPGLGRSAVSCGDGGGASRGRTRHAYADVGAELAERRFLGRGEANEVARLGFGGAHIPHTTARRVLGLECEPVEKVRRRGAEVVVLKGV